MKASVGKRILYKTRFLGFLRTGKMLNDGLAGDERPCTATLQDSRKSEDTEGSLVTGPWTIPKILDLGTRYRWENPSLGSGPQAVRCKYQK